MPSGASQGHGLARRRLLKGAAAGGVLLAGAGWAFWPHGTPPAADPDADGADTYRFLIATDRRILAALLPALVGGVSPTADEAHRVLRDIDATIVRLKPHTGDELRKLFSLLATPAGSYALLGVADVSSAPTEAIERGLAALQQRDFAQFRHAYAGLRELCIGLWYGQPEHWKDAVYPGPPDLAKGPRF